MKSKKQLLVKIHLYIDYVKEYQPMTEKHTSVEVVKETKNRYYFKGRKYVDKNNVNVVRGHVDCTKLNELEYKTICNLSVYCNPKDVDTFQVIIRRDMVLEIEKMKTHLEKFHTAYAHGDLFKKDSPYVKVEEESTVTH